MSVLNIYSYKNTKYLTVIHNHLRILYLLINQIIEDPTIETRLRRTLIDINLTVHSRESRHTSTLIPIDQITARRTILAWARITLIDIHITIATVETRHAGTTVVPDEVVACCAVLAWHGEALVKLDIAVSAGVARQAIAEVGAKVVLADAVLARVGLAFVDVGLAQCAG